MPGPTYPLREIKELVARGHFYITRSSLDGAFDLGFDEQDSATVISFKADESA
jgi:hypothetical protein